MRVSINKLTGKRIGSQSGGDELHPHQIQKVIADAFNIKYDDSKVMPKKTPEELVIEFAPEIEIARDAYRQTNLEVMIQNAVNQGHLRENVEAKFVTDEENAILAEASKPIPTEADLLELEITAKMVEISDRELRVKAIAEIEAENVAEKK